MKPIGRPAFLIATLGCLVIIALMVALFRAYAGELEAFRRENGMADMAALLIGLLLAAGAFVLGLWGWFVARRFLAREISRWPAVLPVALWAIALAVLLVVLEVFDREMMDLAEVGPVLPGDDADEQARAARERAFRAAIHDEMIRRYAGIFSLALTSLAALMTLWCAFRALGRDPVPVEHHFA